MELGVARWQQVTMVCLLALFVRNRAPGVQCQYANFTFVPGDQGFNGTSFCEVQFGCVDVNNPSGYDITFVGNTSSLQLIPDTGGGSNTYMAARYVRDEAVQLWHASFSTFFVLRMSLTDGRIANGMTFFIAPNKTTPELSDGAGVGLSAYGHDSYDPGSLSGIVAIYFDTFQVTGAAPTPNVGLLVHSMTPSIVRGLNATDFFDNIYGVWVEYNVSSMVLELSMMPLLTSLDQLSSDFSGAATYLRHLATHMFSFTFNVTASVDENSYLGFSASTGLWTGKYEIFYWQFEILPQESPAPAPAPDPDQEAGLGPNIEQVPPSGNVVQGLKDSRSGGSRRGVVIAASLIGSAVVAAALVCMLWLWHRGSFSLSWLIMKDQLQGDGDMRDHHDQAAGGTPRIFSYKELLIATEHFGTSQVLGEGGFGKVYKGQLKNGTVVAVKRISQHSRQGEREFLAEVTIIERLRHKNLVPLLGWCRNKDKGELLLVYQYMANGSLDQHLFPRTVVTSSGSTGGWPSVLGWEARYHVLQGVASALLYLQDDWQEAGLQQAVVHLDVKSSNVLLDAQWNARLGDFGLARLVDKHHSRVAAALTTSRVVGTQGYLAPEYATAGKVSVQADVYSFGVLLLEVVTGRRAEDRTRPPWPFVLVDRVRFLLRQQAKHVSGAEFKLEDAAADPALGGHFNSEQLLLLLRMGVMCTAHEPSDRPSMRQVVKSLAAADDRILLPESLLPTTAATLNYSFPGSGNSRPRSSSGTIGSTGTGSSSSSSIVSY